MTLSLGPILADALVIRHAYVREHEDSGEPGLNLNSTDAEILRYTGEQKPLVNGSTTTKT